MKTAARIQIRDWQPQDRNTLRGFFTAEFASGLVIHRLSLMESHGKRWIGLPAREWIDNGRPAYAKLIDFRDKPTQERFQLQLLAAIEEHITGSIRKPPVKQQTFDDKDWEAL